MSKIRVWFSRRSTSGENPTDKISIDWTLRDSPMARKYFEILRVAESTRYIYRRDRFYNFPNEYYSEERVVEKINHSIDVINRRYPGLILQRACLQMSQEAMNQLHVNFEKHRGPLLDPSPAYRDAPVTVREAFDDLNLMIHRYEDLGYSGRALSGDPKIHVCFGLNDLVKRYPLADEDFEEFTFACRFGSWFINYCEVGKPLHDIWRDDDEDIGAEVVLPLRYFSADGLITLGSEVSEEAAAIRVQEFYRCWDTKNYRLEGMGFNKHDPKNALGNIPVAELDREQPLLQGKSNDEIVQIISGYQWLDSVQTL